MIQHCIRFRRLDVMDEMLTTLLEHMGIKFASKYVHGCSKQKIRELLEKDEIWNCSSLRIDAIATHNPEILLEHLAKSLESSTCDKRSNLWQLWQMRVGKKGNDSHVVSHELSLGNTSHVS